MESGRCLFCGSEDVETYRDGFNECLECGATWGGTSYDAYDEEDEEYYEDEDFPSETIR